MEKFNGIITAMVTPMRDGAVDYTALEAFINWQIAEGIHGLVPCGTTGESATLSYDEHKKVVQRTVEIVNGRVPVIAGAGSNATDEAILLAKSAQKSGADAVLTVSPYYNKPSEEGLYAHFKAIHDNTDIPMILYNIPGRSVVNMSDTLIAKLADLPRIIGTKDATGNLARVSTLRGLAGSDFIQLSGEDMTAIGFNAMGGKGVISVSSNVIPSILAKIQQLTLRNDCEAALLLHDDTVDLHEAMFCTSSPAPVKYALSRLGRCTPDVRLPIVPVNDTHKAQIDRAMVKLGII